MKNSLGIIGGVGPLASSYFYELLTTKTKAKKNPNLTFEKKIKKKV